MKVRCIDNDGTESELTIGKIYQTYKHKLKDFYGIKENDKYFSGGYYLWRFEIVIDKQELKEAYDRGYSQGYNEGLKEINIFSDWDYGLED